MTYEYIDTLGKDSKESEDDDYYSEENIAERKELRASLYPKPKKPYYPPYDD